MIDVSVFGKKAEFSESADGEGAYGYKAPFSTYSAFGAPENPLLPAGGSIIDNGKKVSAEELISNGSVPQKPAHRLKLNGQTMITIRNIRYNEYTLHGVCLPVN